MDGKTDIYDTAGTSKSALPRFVRKKLLDDGSGSQLTKPLTIYDEYV
jgi:hypothetical protein